MLKNLTQNLKVKCEFCKKSTKKKFAYFENIKLLEFVHPKNTAFCNKACCENYKKYEMSAPKKASLCSSCPVPPALLK